MILENAVALFIRNFTVENRPLFLRKAFIPYSPELAAGQNGQIFSFWPAKIQKTMEAFRWYIVFPKTMAQAERLMSGIGCIIKCGAAALLIGAV